MDTLSFWKQKIVQAFHDPPAKPYAMYPGTGGHARVAAKLFELFTGQRLRFYYRFPDWAASGADRPVIDPKRQKGISPVKIGWPSKPFLKHPLSSGPVLDARTTEEDTPAARAQTRDILLYDEEEIARQIGDVLSDWHNAEELRHSFFLLWRKFREELISSRKSPEEGDLLWEQMPADGRVPDVSIWDHLRVTTSLAFLTQKNVPDYLEPWFFKFSIGPVQTFIRESRTGRDLWIASFILSDLAWHAMVPVVDRYGPDAVVYPDLRGNPLVDNRLSVEIENFLPGGYRNPRTFAAMLPDSFTAIVPRGRPGNGHAVPVEQLAEEAKQKVFERWNELADIVKNWLVENTGGDESGTSDPPWLRIWERQHKNAIYTYWSALAWKKAEPLKDPKNFRDRALPFQSKDFRQPVSEEERKIRERDRKAVDDRKARLAPFMPLETWASYEWFREVYGLTNLTYLQNERGFEYAVTHHQLRVRHGLREAVPPAALDALEEYGEKCTVCQKRQALTLEDPSGERRIDGARQSAKKFWSHKELDPEKKGAERLCAVCAMKRFLVQAGNDRVNRKPTGINPLWTGNQADYDRATDRDGKFRVPFPSTSTVAAQRFLVSIAQDSSLVDAMEEINRAFDRTPLKRTTFPRVLPRLANVARNASGTVRRFLEIEAQDSIFPDALDGKKRGLGQDAEAQQELDGLIAASKKLRSTAVQNNHGAPGTHFAVIRMDGDSMGRLLLGDRNSIGATMRDILHPDAVEKILKNEALIEAGWPDLLEAKRLAGPSLHAFISRALAGFSHHMVPWVVEREFAGRLIYTGGDDILCLAPAADAIHLAARLQQLFSAPWVIDTAFRGDPWSWRTEEWNETLNVGEDRGRFAVVDPGLARDPVRLPVPHDLLEPHPCERFRDSGEAMPASGRVFPMLGRHASLSAGIVFAHFKTPMSRLLDQSARLLNDLAKDKGGRRSIALSHFSRNGMKTEFYMKWGPPGARPNAQEILGAVLDGFSSGGTLPSRLGYKLREVSEAAAAGLRKTEEEAKEKPEAKEDLEKKRNRFLRGLFSRQLQKPLETEAEENALELWRLGMEQYLDAPWRSVEGLLLLRAVAGFAGGQPCIE